MALTFPRKFTHGQRVSIADVYGVIHIWPDGHFHYTISIRNTEPGEGCRVNVSFVLFDPKRTLLGTFGMLPQQELSISPGGRIHNDFYGRIPQHKLADAASVALAFRGAGDNIDVDKLRQIAQAGTELVFCPTPD